MKKLLMVSGWFLLLTGFLAATAVARGGGGCFEAGTPILTPGGAVVIERLRAGDQVWGIVDGELRPTTVQARVEVAPADALAITVAGRVLRVTGEHPFEIAPGVFRMASALRVGDAVRLWESRTKDSTSLPRAPSAATIQTITPVKAVHPAYNLLVSPGGTYLADGVSVHNKGCFLPDTPILKADGAEIPLRDVRPGDRLLAFTPEGTLTSAQVKQVFTHEVAEYLVVQTTQAILRVTPEHPFYVGQGDFKTIAALHVGDLIFAYDGQGLRAQPILSIERVQARTRVYNLQTDAPNTFFANGLLVHNKGGGCFPAGTLIRTPQGVVAIEQLAPGDVVLAVDARGRLTQTTVETMYATQAALLRVETEDGQTLLTTTDHPLQLTDGSFQAAGALAAGQQVQVYQADRLRMAAIRALRPLAQAVTVFNLTVAAPHTFIADGFVVHNKGGGCFLPETPILKAAGTEIALRAVRPGDLVLAFTPDGKIVPAQVMDVLTHNVAEYQVIRTARAVLQVTPDHPFYGGQGTFTSAARLKVGDPLFAYQGQGLNAEPILSITHIQAPTQVYNLQTAAPHTFFANGILVHNKGGSYHNSGITSGEGTVATLIFMGFFTGIIVLIWFIGNKSAQNAANLDFLHSRTAIAPKANKTTQLLQRIAQTDPAVAPETLKHEAESTFKKLQECWQAREYQPLQPLLTPALYHQHCAQLQSLRRNHEINLLDDLRVEQVDIVHVRYTRQANDREFTALITASARDYYVDDRTEEFLRGDTTAARFQEFWTFRQQDGTWRLREIEQARESKKLTAENICETPPLLAVNAAVTGTAGPAEAAGTAAPKQGMNTGSRLERLLDALERTDPLWNHRLMLERVQSVFTQVFLARETGELPPALADALFPAIAEALRQEFARRQRQGMALEYRNFCVRSAEIILVNNFKDNTRDEFTARISAHAQQIGKRQGKIAQRDKDVTAFQEYWTFGRLAEQWKLKQFHPAARGEQLQQEDSFDQDQTLG